MQQIHHMPLLPKQVPIFSQVERSPYLTMRESGLLQYKVQLTCCSREPGPVGLAYIPQTCNPLSRRRKHADGSITEENLQEQTFGRADLLISRLSDTPAWIHFKPAAQAGKPVLPWMIKETWGLFVILLYGMKARRPGTVSIDRLVILQLSQDHQIQITHVKVHMWSSNICQFASALDARTFIQILDDQPQTFPSI